MLQLDPLFVGPTRPKLIAGVPYEAIIFNGLTTSVVFMGSGNLLYIAVCLPIHAVCYLICQSEPRMFELIFLWTKTKGKNINKRIWAASSYSPAGRFRDPLPARKAKPVKGTE